MNENIKWIAAAVAVVGVTVGGIVYFSQSHEATPVEKPVVSAPPPAEPAEPEIKNPLEASAQPEALPALDDSDVPIENALAGLIGKESIERFVVTKDVARHFVVSIDNLPDVKVAERLRPDKPVSGRFAVSGTEDAPVLDPANYQRYQALVQTIRTTDTAQLVATYKRYYPLFQEAYESLGHPPKYFNDRLIVVIDNLLATPDLKGPIALTQPNVQYEYADPKIEALPAGQKALIRMGGENAAVVKAKLRELRSALAAQPPPKS